VGILSVSALGLFASKSDFSASLAKDQLISSVHLAQQRALASHIDYPVVLSVTQSADSWIFNLSQRYGTNPSEVRRFREQEVDRAGANLTITGLSFPMSIQFSQDGSLAGGSDLTASFTGETSHTVCITSMGFAFAKACP
jgi:type II secretory pathway pseudopilin PulG